VAYVYAGGFMISIVKAFLSLMPERYQVQRRFFHVNERAEAEKWLLQQSELTQAS
jgi:hypothetical protein